MKTALLCWKISSSGNRRHENGVRLCGRFVQSLFQVMYVVLTAEIRIQLNEIHSTKLGSSCSEIALVLSQMYFLEHRTS